MKHLDFKQLKSSQRNETHESKAPPRDTWSCQSLYNSENQCGSFFFFLQSIYLVCWKGSNLELLSDFSKIYIYILKFGFWSLGETAISLCQNPAWVKWRCSYVSFLSNYPIGGELSVFHHRGKNNNLVWNTFSQQEKAVFILFFFAKLCLEWNCFVLPALLICTHIRDVQLDSLSSKES